MDKETQSLSQVARIKKSDADRQIVYAEVYAPYTVDSHGDMMLPEDIELMAHRYLKHLQLEKSVDTNHDNEPNGSYPIESFIARKGDPDFTEGAWVVGVKVEDEKLWGDIKAGRINGYSMETLVKMVPAVASVTVVFDNVGVTEEAMGHTHWYYVHLNDEGKVTWGRTTNDYGHSHEIKYGTATEPELEHAHRFFL